MKIRGSGAFARPKVLVRLGPEDLELEPLKSTFFEEVQRRLVKPRPPKAFAPKPGGGYLKDPKTGRVLTIEDEGDPTYQAALVRYGMRSTIAVFYEATRGVTDITWDATPPAGDKASPDAWAAFYDALITEVEASGLPLMDVTRAAKEIGRDSGITAEELDQVTEDFS